MNEQNIATETIPALADLEVTDSETIKGGPRLILSKMGTSLTEEEGEE